jgi:hypothetical protein
MIIMHETKPHYRYQYNKPSVTKKQPITKAKLEEIKKMIINTYRPKASQDSLTSLHSEHVK